MKKADPRLIVPLDLPTTTEARAMVAALGDAVSFYKIGLELLASDGMGLARELKSQGKSVFLDWKLHDIGETVRRATAALAGSGCDLLTVHAEPQVMAAAVLGRGEGSTLKILAVTVLTSLSDADLIELGRTELARLGIVRAEQIREGSVVRMEKAYPVYDGVYQQHLTAIRATLAPFANLQVVGRNGMHKYNNQDHSMMTAMLAAKNLTGGRFNLWQVNTDAEYHEESTGEDKSGRLTPARLSP